MAQRYIVTGDIRNLATGIISSITVQYDVSIAIALPVAALIVKNGLLNYCSIEPVSPNESVSDILFLQKTTFDGTKEKKKSKKKKKKN